MAPSIQSQYPWTSKPLIINAPMGGFPLGRLAAAVTIAGGLGFISSIKAMTGPSSLESELEIAASVLSSASLYKSNTTLPIGIGFLPFVADLEQALPVIKKWKPHSVWLFAATNLGDYKSWVEKIREATERQTKIWIQVGSVAAALEVAESCSPDMLVAQGLDAGGHGFERGAGIISLLPEMRDAINSKGFEKINIIAAGGIVEGRGVAAALALGADGVVMGTRFLASEEFVMPAEEYRNAILEGRDGGQFTVRNKIFDELKGPNIWPGLYDGRAVVNQSFKDFQNGVGIEELRKLTKEAEGNSDKGFGIDGRSPMWAGTGVGLVNKVIKAGEIVKEVREDAMKILGRV